ncbi:MAG: TIGR04255 family protein [Pseudomonadota bacterium]
MELTKKPLVEAIFEVRWELQGLNNGMPNDPLYEVLPVLLARKLKGDFPDHLRLPSAQIPGMMLPYQPQHQYRSNGQTWPLVQIGAGVLTVNETDTYQSATFLPRCLAVFDKLKSVWNEFEHDPKIVYAGLRYIDAEPLNDRKVEDVLGKLGVTVSLNAPIFKAEFLKGGVGAFMLSTQLQCSEPRGQVALSFNRGQKDGEESLIWETSVSSEGEDCQQFMSSPGDWLKKAHNSNHEIFFSMIDGNLLEKFR